MNYSYILFIVLFIITSHNSLARDTTQLPEKVQIVLENTKPLEYSRNNRLPLYLWSARDVGIFDQESADKIVKDLDERGIGIVCTINKNNIEESISQGITMAKAQKKHGLMVNVDITSLIYGFYIDDATTAHIDKKGNHFFDDSFGNNRKMGCPFTLDERKNEIRDRVNYSLNKYKAEGIEIDFIFADWEIDGPIEVNNAFFSSKKCVRCCENLGEDFGFVEFQKKMREMRSYLQYYAYSSPVLEYFPDALVGNYAVYPNDGCRYWFDYFESFNQVHPFITDQEAIYRQWYNDFPLTGYTCAMPVVYPWWKIFTWYDFENTDYRWFYNMLLNASNAGKSTPGNVPIISFVHWNTVFEGTQKTTNVSQMTKNTYQELLWHMLLRGTDTFFMWSSKNDFPEETRLVQEVYADAQEYGDFLEKGWPITFNVPSQPGVVISGLALNNQVLIRRTDFVTNYQPIQILVGTKKINVDYNPGICKIYDL
jgi:hypothetical protein